jgi:hypothetical protein
MHISNLRYLIRHSQEYRNPVLDAYADLVWTGEAVRRVEEDDWRIIYCGANVSNTVAEVLAEYRPVNYLLGRDESGILTWSPEDQINAVLKYNCKYRTGVKTFSEMTDARFGLSTPYYDSLFNIPYENDCRGIS